MPCPKPLADERRSYWRVVAMAKATGVDLVEACRAKRLLSGDWAAMVQRCRGCDCAAACDRALASRSCTEAARSVAIPCLNQKRFARLKTENAVPRV